MSGLLNFFTAPSCHRFDCQVKPQIKLSTRFYRIVHAGPLYNQLEHSLHSLPLIAFSL